ncbi:MAG: sensor histidine kinase [Christensenellaceae bacterium]|jgi:two-component system sensor histidine kinase YesM
MKRNSGISRRILTITLLLGISVLAVWLVFYIQSSGNIRRMNERYLDQISGQIIERLETELFELENVAFSLSTNETVVDFITEKNTLLFHSKSAIVDDLLDTLTGTGDFSHTLVLYNQDGFYASFMGNLGHTTLDMLFANFHKTALPRYTAVKLEGVPYISYGGAIMKSGEQVGTIVLLAEEEKLLGLFEKYVMPDGIDISLAESGVVVTSSNREQVGISTQELTASAALYQSKPMGFAPFEIYVSVKNDYFANETRDYALAALITVALIIAFLLVYLAATNRYFLRPMVGVIRDVEQLGLDIDAKKELSQTGIDDFDGLVRQVNLMLARLDERSKALLKSQSRLQNAEIERQAALIVSLKKQIDAHFVVNILNIIKTLSERGETEKAALVSDGLSHLLRYSNAEDEFISGMDELLVLEKYVTMMEIRYQDRFSAEFDWSDRLMDAKFPRMLVQPLIENAIVHGFADKKSGGSLLVRGQADGGMVEISVTDNGRGIEEHELQRLRTEIAGGAHDGWNVGGIEHVALLNIARRLRSYYGNSGSLSIESRKTGGTTVTLRFPVAPPRKAVHSDL